MPTLLITGATGFLGTACLRQVLSGGAEVHALARRVPTQTLPGCRFHAADLFDEVAVHKLLATIQPTHLLHLAWITTPGQYWSSPENHRWVEASLHLLRCFAEAGGLRAVFTGTCAEYDWSAGGVCHETRTTLRPATLYGRCKNELRQRAEEVSRILGVNLAWGRLFFLYGPGEHPSRLVPGVTRALLAGQPAPCTVGTQRRDFLHVDDAGGCLLRLLFSEVVGPCNIASGTAVTIRSLVERIAALVGRPDLLRLGERPLPADEPALLVADIGRLRDELNWTPAIPLEKGLADTVSWWRGQLAHAG